MLTSLHTSKIFRIGFDYPLINTFHWILISLVIFGAFSIALAQPPATHVLGQSVSGNPTFVQGLPNNGAPTSDLGFNSPGDLLLDTVNHRLFVSDTQNHRILVFILNNNDIPLDLQADFVIGQPNFTASTPATARNRLNAPTGLLLVGNALFVADTGNNRVLQFDMTFLANGMDADIVLGQGTCNFTTANPLTTRTGMKGPQGLAYVPLTKHLIVADTGNHRILSFSMADGLSCAEQATHVIGQLDFTSGNPLTSQTRFNTPTGLDYDSLNERLFVADTGNHRVLEFRLYNRQTAAFSLLAISGAQILPATNVLGQSTFTTGLPNRGSSTSQSGLSSPTDVSYDAASDRLFVADSGNHRILGFQVKPNRNTQGEDAILVLGQADYAQASTTPISQSSLNTPKGLFFDFARFRLYTADSENHRVLRHVLPQWTVPKLASGSDGVITEGAPYNETLNVNAADRDPGGSLYSYTFSVVQGGLPPGLSLNAGAIAGTPTAPGIFCFTLRVQDQHGLFDEKDYYLHVKPATGSSPGGLVITTPYFSNGVRGYPYGLEITATGGAAPYRWSATNLPPNFRMNPCSGRVEAPHISLVSNFSVTITVMDVYSTPAITKTMNLSLVATANSYCRAFTTELPNATRGQSYLAYIQATACQYAVFDLDLNTPLPSGLQLIDYGRYPSDPIFANLPPGYIRELTAVIRGIPTQATGNPPGTAPAPITLIVTPHHSCPTTCSADLTVSPLLLLVRQPDTSPPTAPSGLVATATGTSTINLSWTASTDNIGVAQYRIERCQGAGCSNFSQVGTTTGISYNDSDLLSNTSYSYRVRAADAAGNTSNFSNISSATTFSPDNEPPSDPTGLTATVVGETQINLSWTGSTDNIGVAQYRIERCQGTGCTSFTQIATATGTTYNNTGLSAGTAYSYRVRAADAVGNTSNYSNTATATTPDTTPPSAPTGLTATAVSGTQINLSWTASTDNVGVTEYRIERCQGTGCTSFTQIATATTTTYSNTGLQEATSYSYRVRAADAAGNLGNYSNTATATTIDTTPPSSPTNLTATAVSGTQISLSWTASTDNVGVTEYRIERCQGAGCTSFTQIATATTTTYSNSGLSSGIEYGYRVRAADAAGNLSNYSNTASATTPLTPDFTLTLSPPSGSVNPGNSTTSTMTITSVNSFNTQVDLSCSTTLPSVTCSLSPTSVTPPANQTATSVLTITTQATTPSGNYTITVTGISGGLSHAISFPLSVSDTTSPSAPTGLTATVVSGTQINLSWTASTDNVGVTEYRIERCQGTGCTSFTQIATATTTTYSNTGLQEATSYSYRVRAADAAGNLGNYSNTATATTPDTTPPSSPTNLTATAVSSTQINLSWTASTDNVGITVYRIERCQGTGCTSFTQIAPTAGTTTSFTNNGLSPGITYCYRVRAEDSNGNLGPYSNTACTTAASPLQITTTSLKTGTVGQPYSDQVQASGGTSPYTWSLTPGSLLPTGLTFNTTTGSITGTPIIATTSTIEVRVTDSLGATATKSGLSITINPAPVSIAISGLPSGIRDIPYTAPLSATGGTPPYTWSISSGSLPPGLDLDQFNNEITGTPTQAGTFSFTLVVTDGSTPPLTHSVNLSIIISPPGELAITTQSLPDAYRFYETNPNNLIPGPEGSAEYFAQIKANDNGTKPYTWSIVPGSGSLPSSRFNLRTDPATNYGIIEGITQDLPVGIYPFTVRVQDSSSPPKTANQILSIKIEAQPKGTTIDILPVQLPDATLGTPYESPSIQAVIGNPSLQLPVTWSIGAGTLPSGLGITLPDPNDTTKTRITGTPSGSPGTYPFTVTALEFHHSGIAKLDLTLTVRSSSSSSSCETSGNGLTIVSTTLPMGVVGVSYRTTLSAVRVNSPQTPATGLIWNICDGSLPAGLEIDPSTGEIHGTPTSATPDNASFTIKATDPSTGNSTISLYTNANNIMIIDFERLNPRWNIDTRTSATTKNRVDGYDLGILKRAFGSNRGETRWNVIADLNKDGVIDGRDLSLMAPYFGKVSK